MMMPANYSAIAENEMTYVSGGNVEVGSLGVASTLISNVMTLIGNSFMTTLLSNTLGTWFGGYWGVKGVDGMVNKDGESIRNTAWNRLVANAGHGTTGAAINHTGLRNGASLYETAHYGYDEGTGFRGVVNAGMQVVGGLMALAQLCVVDAAPTLGDDIYGVDGAL